MLDNSTTMHNTLISMHHKLNCDQYFISIQSLYNGVYCQFFYTYILKQKKQKLNIPFMHTYIEQQWFFFIFQLIFYSIFVWVWTFFFNHAYNFLSEIAYFKMVYKQIASLCQKHDLVKALHI